jgi:DNA-binding transcriptional ArsR family regulator
VGGFTGVALVVGGHVEALAGQFGDQPGWPPEPGHPQPHHQQQGLTPGTAEFFEGDAGRAVARVAGRAGPGLCHGTSRSQFENAVCKLSLPVRKRRSQKREFGALLTLLDISKSALSKHISVLAEAGYIAQRRAVRDTRQRVWLRLTDTPGEPPTAATSPPCTGSSGTRTHGSRSG